MGPIEFTMVSVLVVSLVSLVGVFTLLLNEKKTRKILIFLVAFSAGALFGDAFIHILPEVVEAGFTPAISFYILAGIVAFLAIEKLVHWRHCHMITTKDHPHPFAYMNLFGDTVHNFIDGMIIAASYLISTPVGIATTFAVILHEVPQEIGDFGVLLHGGFSNRKAIFLNFVTALSAFLGAIFALMISGYVGGSMIMIASFAAGGFIYIAGSDLIPELNKEYCTKHAFLQVLFVALGIAIMYTLLLFEV
jgi:zinc and cadmium transporter